jgi:hypothetical protein
MLERLDKGNARILATATTAGQSLVVGLWLKRDAKPLDSERISGPIEPNPGDADARVIALRDEPRKQVELAIGAANGSRIQDPFDLQRTAGFRLH